MGTFRNIAGYRFTHLKGFEDVRYIIRDQCREWGFKGTIHLSPEGVNVSLAGEPEKIELFKPFFEQILGLESIVYKESDSDYLPYKRMLVRVKQRLLPADSSIDPSRFTGPSISPVELKRWLDEGREFILLDTRNSYEYNVGTFKNAVDPGMRMFNQLENKVNEVLPPDAKDKPLVMFCTGGIRCEKASPILLNMGFKEVYQLEGGILNYFKECGSAHYEGNCFVFDKREVLNPQLEEVTDRGSVWPDQMKPDQMKADQMKKVAEEA